MKKKILSILLCIICLFGTAACDDKKEDPNDKVKVNEESNLNEEENSSTEEPEESTTEEKDTEAPVLKLKNVSIAEGKSYQINDFVDRCTDNSKEKCILEFKEEKKYTKKGTYTVTIVAKDSSGNKTEETAKLTITKKEGTSEKSNTNTQSNTQQENSSTNSTKPATNNNTSSTTKPTTGNKTPTFVEKKKEVEKIRTNLKYGGVRIEVQTKTYDLYSDGTTKNNKITISYEYDSSGFNAKTSDLLPEAKQNRKTYANDVNEILKYVNQYRAEVGASPLTIDETLTEAAMTRALEIGYGIYAHERPNGSKFYTVLKDMNYTYQTAGENIAAGYRSAAAVSDGWYHSPGHYSNMVNTNFHKIGIGRVVVDGYSSWVQLFSN